MCRAGGRRRGSRWRIAEEGALNLDFEPADEEFRAEVRAFLADRLPERWVGIWHGQEALATSYAVTREMAAKGWLTQLWPAEYGGADASVWRQVVLQEELWAHHEPRGGQYMALNWVGPSLMSFGTEEQKQRYLPEIATGDVQWAQLYSEPDAGSDLANLSTRADQDGDSLVITGEKIWTSYAGYADHGFLVCRTTPESTRRQGLSVLLVEDMRTPGITIREIPTPLGHYKFHSVVFEGARVPASSLLGTMGDGWAVAQAALAFERVGAPRYARATRTLGHIERTDSVDDPVIEDQLARLLAMGRACELMAYSNIAARVAGDAPRWLGSATRIGNTVYEQEVAVFAERALGAHALPTADDDRAVAGGEVEEFDRIAPTAGVAAGTYEIQMGIVAAQGLGLERGA